MLGFIPQCLLELLQVETRDRVHLIGRSQAAMARDILKRRAEESPVFDVKFVMEETNIGNITKIKHAL